MKGHFVAAIAIAIVATLFFVPITFAGPGAGGQKACNDGADNDGDTYTDWPADPGCSSKNDNSELGTAQCDNGLDDDLDTYTDYPDDSGCTSPTDNTEASPDSCSDTDSGYDVYAQGTTSGYYNNLPYDHTDYCASGALLNEYSCNGAYEQSDNFDCTSLSDNQTMNYTCTYGACVVARPPPPQPYK
ncbi:MAG: hypothetical protein Q7T16_02195 [Candidatus Burarchaeum sp.]|nr:hypothetical protein [Candidatus Burarchaeum sp.]MDO8339445.1 hypothetical protein [Candidatus Burarchaeum sp.]